LRSDQGSFGKELPDDQARQGLEGLDDLGLDEGVKTLFLGGNAQRMLRINTNRSLRVQAAWCWVYSQRPLAASSIASSGRGESNAYRPTFGESAGFADLRRSFLVRRSPPAAGGGRLACWAKGWRRSSCLRSS
jgi:hypothetical protein